MRRLIRGLRAERGATATVVAFAIIPLLGAGAIAIDVGALYAERAQLQNGVDAAALAVAASCARDESACGAGSTVLAQQYVDDNAAIFREPAADAPSISTSDNTVTVTANTGVDHMLAQLIVGDDASNVFASGSAEWGTPIAGGVLPVGFGSCEFEGAEPGEMLAIELGVKARADCPNVTDNPGGFGWLDAADCFVHFDLSDGELWHLGESGMGGGSSGCNPKDDFTPLLDSVILIPIFDSFKYVKKSCTEAPIATPTKECYRIAKFAAFRLTGGKLTSFTHIDKSAPACKAGCLQGEFVKYVAIDDSFELGDGDSSSLSVVRMILTDNERTALIG
ncbi:pilus assembly protein TadG-related protein [Agromyces sp. GXS1127]|uniref:pilus assembly protein TadG-related protein n=1 Tax=Agromyces sp. GXS1127 TaxID=3424181 RepID=UPI003D315E43